jgi:hypothetical protein
MVLGHRVDAHGGPASHYLRFLTYPGVFARREVRKVADTAWLTWASSTGTAVDDSSAGKPLSEVVERESRCYILG